MANAQTPGNARPSPSSAWSSWPTQAEIACPSVSGVASCRWVRPTITTPENAVALAFSVSRNARMAGMSTVSSCSTVAMCIAVGNVSLDDWLWFTSSLG